MRMCDRDARRIGIGIAHVRPAQRSSNNRSGVTQSKQERMWRVARRPDWKKRQVQEAKLTVIALRQPLLTNVNQFGEEDKTQRR